MTLASLLVPLMSLIALAILIGIFGPELMKSLWNKRSIPTKVKRLISIYLAGIFCGMALSEFIERAVFPWSWSETVFIYLLAGTAVYLAWYFNFRRGHK